MKTKHTPGPWSIHFGAAQGGEGHHIVDSNDLAELSRIAVVFFHDDEEGETRANAQLIAAAPELLESLKVAMRVIDSFAPSYADRIFADEARAAIAKATGATP